MTEGMLQALVWTSHSGDVLDLMSIPGLWCVITSGLDDLPRLRVAQDIVPFRPGRLQAVPIGDARPVVVEGRIIPDQNGDYVRIISDVKRALDPFEEGRGTLRATLEDGTVLAIAATPASVLLGEPLRIMPSISIELDAEPFWRGVAWGTAWRADMGLRADTGLVADMSAGPITMAPTSDPFSQAYVTLGTTGTLDAVVHVDGPSTGAITVRNADGIGFGYPALSGGQTLVVDAGAHTARIAGVSVRGSLTLLTPNRNREFFRLRGGNETLTVTGHPAEVRIVFHPTYV
jgi:hypothetical protein